MNAIVASLTQCLLVFLGLFIAFEAWVLQKMLINYTSVPAAPPKSAFVAIASQLHSVVFVSPAIFAFVFAVYLFKGSSTELRLHLAFLIVAWGIALFTSQGTAIALTMVVVPR